MKTTERGDTTELTDFHKTMFNLILLVGIACAIALAGFEFFLAGGTVVILTLAVEIGNIAIYRRRIRQAPIRAFSDVVNEFRNEFGTDKP